jgi:hypothetical protein
MDLNNKKLAEEKDKKDKLEDILDEIEGNLEECSLCKKSIKPREKKDFLNRLHVDCLSNHLNHRSFPYYKKIEAKLGNSYLENGK